MFRVAGSASDCSGLDEYFECRYSSPRRCDLVMVWMRTKIDTRRLQGSERATRIAARVAKALWDGFSFRLVAGPQSFFFTSSTQGQKTPATRNRIARTQSAALSRYNGEALCMLLPLGLDIRPQVWPCWSSRRLHAMWYGCVRRT